MATLEISPNERQHVEYLSDLFAVIVAIEQIEKAHRRDYITGDEYSATVRRLLEKYKVTLANLEKSRNPHFTNVDDFFEKYCSRCPAAITTIKEGPASSAKENSARFLARQAMECGQFFITLLDALRLQQTAVDALNPLLTDLIQGLGKLNLTQEDFCVRLSRWKSKLDGMSAADMLGEGDSREFAYDLERGYGCLRSYLEDDAVHK